MDLGKKLLDCRKNKGLSQEEVADKLNVSRQTVSKWETNASTPDFSKIVPICELYEISPDELLMDKKEEKEEIKEEKCIPVDNTKNRAKGIGIGVFSYFVAVVWIMISIPVLVINPVLASGIFLLICGVGTAIIIYTCIVYKKKPTEVEKNPLLKKIDDIVSLVTLLIYLVVSFTTMAWHITWIIWIIYALIMEVIKLILMLRENKNEV